MSTRPPTLSRYTPSVMSAQLLERLFVARERLLATIVERVAAADASDGRNHTLLVGPRGAGKTHLVSLVAHRVRAARPESQAQLAWLPEDPWTIVSYRHFLTAIVERLEPKFEETVPRNEQELEAILARRAADHGPMTVIVENLDQILHALDDDGQQRLRHLLQSDRSLLLVATSTTLDRVLSDQASPFYGFFTTTKLDPFGVPEATAMLTAIARERGDDRLVEYLATDQAARRLRTIAHLAGGQPRLWAVLASALTTENLNELVDLLLTRFDDLTPYYQEQLGRLSGHQRLVVAELAEIDRPINVRELAERIGIEQRSLGKTMSELVERGWATPTTSRYVQMLDARRTYYELAEPLARLSFQIKESRGEPLRLIVEFVKHWFDPEQLAATQADGAREYVALAVAGHGTDAVVSVSRTLQRLPSTRAPAAALLGEVDDALSSLAVGDPESFLRLPSPIRLSLEDRLKSASISDVRCEIHTASRAEFGTVPHPSIDAWIGRARSLIDGKDDGREWRLFNLANWLGRSWRFTEASEVISGLDLDGAEILFAKTELARAFHSAGRSGEAMRLVRDVVEVRERKFGPMHRDTLFSKDNLAITLADQGDLDGARELFEAVYEARAETLGTEHDETLVSKNNLALALSQLGDADTACQLQQEVVEIRERTLGIDHIDTLASKNNLANFLRQRGALELGLEMHYEVLEARKRTLGVEHLDTLRSQNNLAIAMADHGDLERSCDLHRTSLAIFIRVLGADHPETLRSQHNLASTVAALGDIDEARTLMTEVVNRRGKILGVHHPETVAGQSDLATLLPSSAP